MKNNQLPFPQRLFLPVGLLLVTLPLLFREYIPLSDFFRGLLAGGGITLEIMGMVAIVKQKRFGKQASSNIVEHS